MALIIGMDEAGYGPNLGPLIVGATAWEVPGDPRTLDLWQAFAGVVEQSPPVQGSHVQVADSKQVYSPTKGLEHLEQGLLHGLAVLQSCLRARDPEYHTDVANPQYPFPQSFRELLRQVTVLVPEALDVEPWFAGADRALPFGLQLPLASAWHVRCQSHDIRLRAMRADVVLTRRFNELTRANDSKGRALSEISMHLLEHVWRECDGEKHDQVLILADKHGGRNRYQEFLPIVFGDRFIRCLRESAESSRYAVGAAEIRFETKSERHLPVALASMLCKYLRELSMEMFNRFWTERQPGLKATAGYPQDARRFKQEIAALQAKLGIDDEVLWRER
jgi:hypothetical protein